MIGHTVRKIYMPNTVLKRSQESCNGKIRGMKTRHKHTVPKHVRKTRYEGKWVNKTFMVRRKVRC